jgi:hypothetical protein
MKSFFTFLIPVILILSCSGCNKDQKEKDIIETYENQDEMVEQFVQSLLDSTYSTYYIPYFNPEAITPLLDYADDFSPIYYFPASLLSSFYFEPKKLGESMLWTIESIRVKHPLNEENRFNQFVSSQPLLLEKKFLEDLTKPEFDPLDYRLDNQQLYEVYNAYKEWWENYNHENFQQIRKINPLNDLNYLWF